MKIDLGQHVDSFAKDAHIPSRLIVGDPALLPQPHLSIVMPTFRRADLLRLALESALNQQDPGFPYEVVVVDNDPEGQADGPTQQLIEALSQDRLLYYRNRQNLGIAGNWNRCASLARGHYVAYLHDDDLLRPDYLVRMGKLLAKKPQAAGIMVLPYDFSDESGLETAAAQREKSAWGKRFDQLAQGKLLRLRPLDSHLKLSNVFSAPTCGSVFDRDKLLASGGFNPDFHPSFDWFTCYALCRDHKVYRSMERLGYYRTFSNESLKPQTKAAFIRDRLAFRDYAARTSRSGRWLKALFGQEQNREILDAGYTRYQGRDDDAFLPAGERRVRPVHKLAYRILTQGYWRIKNYASLLLG